MRYLFRATLEGGKLHLDNPGRMAALVKRLEMDDVKAVVVSVEPEPEAKSQSLDRYLWGIVYGEAARKTGHTPHEIHEAVKGHLGADTLARTVVAPTELPVGAMTALAGAPFFIYLLRRRLT